MGWFASRNLRKHKDLAFRTAAENLLPEDDRVYRNQVELFSERYSPATVSAQGLFKARLFSTTFPLLAFLKRWGDGADGRELMNVLSGLAIMPLSQLGASPAITRESGEAIALPFMQRQLLLIGREIEEGPSSPLQMTEGFEGLVESCHEAFEDSVGKENYTSEARTDFDSSFRGSVFGRLRLLSDLIEQMR